MSETSPLRSHLAHAALALALIACGGSGPHVSGSTQDMSSGGLVCSFVDFNPEVTAFCKKQFPAPPAAGATGAACTGDTQCSSQRCLMPFGSGEQYCTVPCPNGTECPVGFTCQDAGPGNGSLCYRAVCIYGGQDPADCVVQVKTEIDSACRSGCGDEFKAWIDCLANAPLICSQSEAQSRCGIERGFLDTCCPSCNSQSF